MRQAALLGNAGTKRTDYFRQAAIQAKLPVFFADWKDFEEWKKQLTQGEWLIKIDPPLWESFSLRELDRLVWDYERKLYELSEMARKYQLEFLNDPQVIAQLLDKRACKEKLEQAGLAVTERLEDQGQVGLGVAGRLEDQGQVGLAVTEQLEDQGQVELGVAGRLEDQGQVGLGVAGQLGDQGQAGKAEDRNIRMRDGEKTAGRLLIDRMRQQGICQVFIKPVNGSGAAGVSAFRVHPSADRMVLYTCALEHPEHGLVNTKRLRRFSGQEEVCSLLNRILELDCIVERWYAKAEYQGYSYDLRAVVLDGRLEFLLGRLSKGPITNLHLNNHPLEAGALGIPDHRMEEIAVLCKKAVDCFPGLRCAGIDILLEKGSLRPRIIEMNAQGDLIYQDIFCENRIYRREAEMMGKVCDT